MKVLNLTKNTTIAVHAELASSPWSRMKGLLGRSSLPENTALIITRCNSIHMFFMKFPIDVIFVNQENVVVGLVRNILPFRLSRIFWRAKDAIELPCGVIENTQTRVGDKLSIEE